jgi:hypothetical protein
MIDTTLFEHGAAIYPQPIALSCGRICRARTPQGQLDAIVRCAEVVTRYLAALSVSSFAARDDQHISVPGAFGQFRGNLSFGHFLSIVQGVAATNCDHPLRQELAAGFADKDGTPGPANSSLTALLKLRNHLGHDLMNISEARATAIFEADAPDSLLVSALNALESLLRLPLFLVEEQRMVKRQLVARRLLLMGESPDPMPEEIELSESLMDDHLLYVGFSNGVLSLHPLLIWDLAVQRANYSLYFIHAIDAELTFITVNSDRQERNHDLVTRLQQPLSGGVVPLESVTLRNGVNFLQEWQSKRKGIEQAWQSISGQIPWDDLEPETLRWYGRQFGAVVDDAAIRQTISEHLLDGRDRLTPEEVQQIILLFGHEDVVRQQLRRNMIDCRARKKPDTRWDERYESARNVLESLKLTIEFFGRHVAVGDATLDALNVTSGTADYIAMREGLVNLFIHQDYTDARTVSQVEITPDRAVFFNAGKSLIGKTALIEGGKSQSRNPLISRALRLIGFAELAGSGLREVYRVWNGARRRPPVVESNSAANTFSLTLDWRELPDITDVFWKDRLGVKLMPDEAAALLLAAEPAGVHVDEIAASQGMLIDEATRVKEALITKALVVERKDRIYAQEHLKALIEEAKVNKQ